MKIAKIVSGGQTGADRAALDAAIYCGVLHGGWCPKGHKAEDGIIPDKYNLTETVSKEYLVRTRRNVEDSDLTIIFSHGKLTGGSLRTLEFAKTLNKPYVHIDLDKDRTDNLFNQLSDVLIYKYNGTIDAYRLNVAGPRASSDPQIYDAVYGAVTKLLRSSK